MDLPSCQSILFFSLALLIFILFQIGNKVFLEQSMLYDLRRRDDSYYDFGNFEKIWQANKAKNQKNPLLKSLYQTFKSFCF